MNHAPHSPSLRSTVIPCKPIDRLVGPVAQFMHIQAASGVVLLTCTVIALAIANSPWATSFEAFWKLKVGFSIGSFTFQHSLKHWINDGLMAIFFFVIGLEVKREIVFGELKQIRTAALPIAAAIGGMIIPALIFYFFIHGHPGERGWGIPMATDIAFVVGCLALFGDRVPRGLRMLLLTLAIADDIGAILVIAVVYTENVNLVSLALGGLGFGVVITLLRLGVTSLLVYMTVASAIWFAFHESGVHATIAGVILGLLTPVRPLVSHARFARIMEDVQAFIHGEAAVANSQDVARTMALAARESLSPLERLESTLHPWVSFIIMPVFALANAGVVISAGDFTHPLAVAVAVGLLVGKPAGIALISWIAIRTRIAQLSSDMTWPLLIGGGCLAGIGFTMSLFIAGLALNGALLEAAKVGVLSGSALSAAIGMTILALILPKKSTA